MLIHSHGYHVFTRHGPTTKAGYRRPPHHPAQWLVAHACRALPAQADLNERNTAWNESARRSANFDLSHEDRAPDLDLNEVVWKAIHGEQAIMPAPRRSAFVKLQEEEEDED